MKKTGTLYSIVVLLLLITVPLPAVHTASSLALTTKMAVNDTAPTHIYLPVITKSAGGGVTPPGPGDEGALFVNTTTQTNSASSAVDAAGGFHFAYTAYSPDENGNYPAYYTSCAENCASQASWSVVSFSELKTAQEVQLALTSTGHPRLLITGEDANYDTQFQYAACDNNCTNTSGWTITNVATSTEVDVFIYDYAQHSFALDSLDRPRFIYQKTNYGQSYYVFCDLDCANMANWREYLITADILSYPTLAFTSSDQPRIAAIIYSGGDAPSMLQFLACDSDCANAAGWSYTPLIEGGSGHKSYVLRLDSNDRPRIAFHQGSLDNGQGDYLYYLWCNTGCSNGANWSGYNIGVPQGQAQDPDLALDTQNRPRITYRNNSPDGLVYAWCDTSCETLNAAWNAGTVETGTKLDADWPILPPANCSVSYWYSGYRSSLSLDPSGNPRIGYDAEHLHGGGSCTVDEDHKAVRFVFFNQP